MITGLTLAIGVLIGLGVATLIVILLPRYQTPIERADAQTQSKLKQKGSILEPNHETIDSWLKELPDDNSN